MTPNYEERLIKSLHTLFILFGGNDDRLLTRAEFRAAHEKYVALPGEDADTVFDEINTDKVEGDEDILTFDEFLAYHGIT